MATDQFPKAKLPYNFSAEERRERFLVSKAKVLAGERIDVDDSTGWHEVDHPLTSQQRDLISREMQKIGRHSPVVWLKMLEPGTGRVIRCRGLFDHRSGSWFAGFGEVEQGSDGAFLVSPIAAHRQE
jgi:hypothetical protein